MDDRVDGGGTETGNVGKQVGLECEDEGSSSRSVRLRPRVRTEASILTALWFLLLILTTLSALEFCDMPLPSYNKFCFVLILDKVGFTDLQLEKP